MTVILGVAAALLVALWGLQRRLIYFPEQILPPRSVAGDQTEAVTLVTEDGLELGAWFIPTIEPERPVVIVFNGNAGNRGDRISLAQGLVEANLAVLLVDYRGYGGNPGSPSEKGLALDAHAARDFVDERWAGAVVYFGESLGSGVATELAAQREPAALVLRSPFTSLGDVGQRHYPFLPVRALLWDDYPTEELVAGVTSPILVVAGSSDEIVPFEMSRKVFDAAPGTKQWLEVSGARHNDAELVAGPTVIRAIADFVAEHVG